MSRSPDEPGHEQLGWTHAICDCDYFSRAPGEHWPDNPHRVRDERGEPIGEWCCYCGELTRGIFVREDARRVHETIAGG